MAFKSVLSPEGSIIMGGATVGVVFAIYQLDVGSVSMAHATPPNTSESSALESSRKKAGYTALVAVAGIALIARDPNIVILGGASIMAMEAHYRHAIMVHPDTGSVVPPVDAAYQSASNVVPITQQGDTVSYG
jgi:hypothetical protein